MNIKKKVYTVIKKINPKNKLTNADIELIFEYFEYFSFTKNSELKKNNMAILILEGNIARYENEKLLENLHSPVLLREGNLINQMTHKHKIIPTTAGYGFYIDKDRYVTFQFEHPEISLLFIDLILNSTNLIMNSKITNNNKKNILKKISLFKVFNNEEILKIIEKSKIEYFKYGEKIIQKGQDVNYAYIIIFGEAVDSQNVSKTNGEDRLLTVGDIINAKALFGDSISEKTVIANNDVKVL